MLESVPSAPRAGDVRERLVRIVVPPRPKPKDAARPQPDQSDPPFMPLGRLIAARLSSSDSASMRWTAKLLAWRIERGDQAAKERRRLPTPAGCTTRSDDRARLVLELRSGSRARHR
jgi:hypothetical protein